MQKSMTILRFITVTILLAISACDDKPTTTPKTTPPQPVVLKPTTIWGYLETLRGESDAPRTKEIVALFGEPDEKLEEQANAEMIQGHQDAYFEAFREYKHKDRYYRFSETDQKNKWVDVVVWWYHLKRDDRKDENRATLLSVRKSNGEVVGWSWFENVPAGQEIGPPKN